MPVNNVVRARIDQDIKEEASAALASMGLTVSDALRIMLTRVAREKALPFEVSSPNATTIAAMGEAGDGNSTIVLTRRGSVTLLELIENPPPRNKKFLAAQAKFSRMKTGG